MEDAARILSENERRVSFSKVGNDSLVVLGCDRSKTPNSNLLSDQSNISAQAEKLPENDRIADGSIANIPVLSVDKASDDGAISFTPSRQAEGFISSSQSSIDEARDQHYDLPNSSPLSTSAFGSIASPAFEESNSDGILQVYRAGQQFSEGDESIPNFDDDSDLHEFSEPEGEVSQAVRAPFREGGLPIISRKSYGVEEPSEITDFGEAMYAKSRKSVHRKSTSSLPTRNGERRSAKKTLSEQLFSDLQVTHPGRREFFPRNIISTRITQDCVRDELSKHLDADAYDKKVIREYARKICEEAEYDDNGVMKIRCFRKIFVILVLIEKTAAIIKFVEKDVNDSDLPLEKIPRPHEKGAYDLRLSRNPTKRLKCFSKKWNQLHIRNFEEYQWKTISPFFGKGGHRDVKHYPLQDQVILPFILPSAASRKSLSEIEEFEGGFGEVSRATIHPDHHNFDCLHSKMKAQSFAIKKLRSRDKGRFKQEVEMLKKFSYPPHDHLISLLATYEQFKNYYLIFHWAEADLQRYWRKVNPEPSMDKQTVMWVAKQCTGIAHGVLKIHQYRSSNSKLQPLAQAQIFGHHGDIKAENVLWFPDQDQVQTKLGTLKLSDFGLAEISMHQTVSMMPKSNFATSPPYRAPEVDLEGTGAIGRSYDMWTLGCLYLEFITWLIGGWSLVNDFQFRRLAPDPMVGHDTSAFFRLVRILQPDGSWGAGAEIKPAVTTFMSELYENESCTQFIREFLDMVKADLLVIKTQDIATRGRKTSEEVHKTLRDMLKKCEADRSYACKSVAPLGAVGKNSSAKHRTRRFQRVDILELPDATNNTYSSPSNFSLP